MSKEFWYTRLKSFVPGNVYQDDETTEAIFWGMAAVMDRVDQTLDVHIKQTYLAQAEGGYLNEHGLERNLLRAMGELDPSFSARIRNITNSTNCPDIKALVDALLEVGQSSIVEDELNAVYYSRGNFFNRGEILIDAIINTFSILVDNQVHAPYSFYTRDYFYNREDFIGRQTSSTELFELIIQAVNETKAFGTAYRLIERLV